MSLILSNKGNALISLYDKMVVDGYEREDTTFVKDAFGDFELRSYAADIATIFSNEHISSTLDYGCGGSNWKEVGFEPETNKSAKEYFNLDAVYHYEPSRDIDERTQVDCVVSFDVLEHIHILDVANVLRDMFSHAKKICLLNIACYPAAAKLPNGENAHITVRPKLWWKGVIDMIAVEYPHVQVYLITSTAWQQSELIPTFSAKKWIEQEKFVVDL